MEYLDFALGYSIAFVSFFTLCYFQIYSKLKELERNIGKKGTLKEVKKMFLEEHLGEIKSFFTFLIISFIVFILASIAYWLGESIRPLIVIVIMLTVIFQLLFFMFLLIRHNQSYRDLANAVRTGSNLGEFLFIFGIEKKKSKIIGEMIKECKSNKDILGWFLYYIGFKEEKLTKSRIIKKK